jgi:hypothetical protein
MARKNARRYSGQVHATRKSGSIESSMNINSATLQQLETLPGISADTAAAIIAHRPLTGAGDLGRMRIFVPAAAVRQMTFEPATPVVDVPAPIAPIPAAQTLEVQSMAAAIPEISVGITSVPPLVIVRGGSYTAQAGQAVVIADTDGGLITIHNSPLIVGGITQTTTKPVFLGAQNNIFQTASGKQAITLWRVTHVDVECNRFTGGAGVLIGNFGSGIDGSVRANQFYDIDGTVGPGNVVKVSAIALQHWNGPFNISYNEIFSTKSGPVAEDFISAMQSTGSGPNAQFVIHNNFVQGCATSSKSGSGICVDPGLLPPGDPRAQGPLNVVVRNNIVCRIPNQMIDIAYGSGVIVQANLTVNDGRTVPWVDCGILCQNWRGVTTAANYGVNVDVYANQSCCLTAHGERRDYLFTHPIVGTNNSSITVTDQYALDEWNAMKASAHIKPGPTLP